MISGIYPDVPLGTQRGDVIFDTEEIKRDWGLPDNYIVINYDATMNGMYCLPLGSNQLGPVVYDYELNTRSFYKIYDSFTSFLLSFIEA